MNPAAFGRELPGPVRHRSNLNNDSRIGCSLGANYFILTSDLR